MPAPPRPSRPVTDIAYAAGFGSTRRLYTLFIRHYGAPPGAWRRTLTDTATDDTIPVEMAYRPPYAWDAQLEFLATPANPEKTI